MTPEATVNRLAELLDALPLLSEDGVYDAMESAGIPARDADLAYKFLQIACGRQLLHGLVGRFSDDYFCLDASGVVIESGRLQENPFFTSAAALISRAPRPWAGPLGAMSADVSVVNDALKKGSKPGKLQTGPAVMFLEKPTAAGLENANRLILERLRPPEAPKKPWWKFR